VYVVETTVNVILALALKVDVNVDHHVNVRNLANVALRNQAVVKEYAQ